nr:hypothetical protein [Tanacetum cinerariifolium]
NVHAFEDRENAHVGKVLRHGEGAAGVAHGQNVVGPSAVKAGLEELVERAVGHLADQVALNVGAGRHRALANAGVGDLVAGLGVHRRRQGVAGEVRFKRVGQFGYGFGARAFPGEALNADLPGLAGVGFVGDAGHKGRCVLDVQAAPKPSIRRGEHCRLVRVVDTRLLDAGEGHHAGADQGADLLEASAVFLDRRALLASHSSGLPTGERFTTSPSGLPQLDLIMGAGRVQLHVDHVEAVYLVADVRCAADGFVRESDQQLVSGADVDAVGLRDLEAVEHSPAAVGNHHRLATGFSDRIPSAWQRDATGEWQHRISQVSVKRLGHVGLYLFANAHGSPVDVETEGTGAPRTEQPQRELDAVWQRSGLAAVERCKGLARRHRTGLDRLRRKRAFGLLLVQLALRSDPRQFGASLLNLFR